MESGDQPAGEQDSLTDSESWKEARDQRRDALRHLAEDRASSAPPASERLSETSLRSLAPMSASRSRRPRWVTLAVVVAVIIVSGGAYAVARTRSDLGVGTAKASPTPLPTVALHTATGFACLYPPAWSPRGDMYAVLGSATPCAQMSASSASPLSIELIAASSGAVTQHISLALYLTNPHIQTCLVQGSGHKGCPQVLVWSPNETKLVASLLLVNGQGFPVSNAALIIPADGAPGAVIVGPPLGDTSYTVYDLSSHTARNVSLSADLGAADLIQWGSGGAFERQNGIANAPVGNPAGGTAFSPWQPGILSLASLSLADFSTVFGAWSPDGRYVAMSLTTYVQLPVAAPPTTPDTSQPVVVRAPRDAALATLVNMLSAQASSTSLTLAWDISGAHLLEVRCSGPDAASLTVLSTATGDAVAAATLTLGNTPNSCFQIGLVAAWSPDGSSVLLASQRGGTLARWTPKLSA